MRKIIALILLLTSSSYAQNIYQFVKSHKALKVTRTITVLKEQENLARRVLNAKIIDNEQMRRLVALRATHIQPLVRPSSVVGSNNYLRNVASRFKTEYGWKEINKTNGYNGAHHIITKSVLGVVSKSTPEMINNAPSVFHPLHNDPRYIDIFHNHLRQIELYYKGGVKVVILDFFERVNAKNIELGLPEYTPQQIEQTLLETELWSKHWGLKWD